MLRHAALERHQPALVAPCDAHEFALGDAAVEPGMGFMHAGTRSASAPTVQPRPVQAGASSMRDGDHGLGVASRWALAHRTRW